MRTIAINRLQATSSALVPVSLEDIPSISPPDNPQMSSRSIPPLLEPYLSLPPETSLIVLTSVLGASTNWLVLRHLHTLLLNSKHALVPSPSPDGGSTAEPPPVSVLLVSFLRDYPFWRDAASRVGVDLEGAGRKGRFGFVDGLGMFLPATVTGEKAGMVVPWRTRLESNRLDDVRRTLAGAVEGMAAKGGKVVLVIDQLDVLLATADEEGYGEGLRGVVLELREVCQPPPFPWSLRGFLRCTHLAASQRIATTC